MNCDSYAFIITFIGPVGVGKSTHIRLTKRYLRSKKTRVSTTFIKSSHALTYIVEKPLMLLGAYEKVPSEEGIVRIYPRRDIFARLLPLWCLLDVLSIATKFFFTVYMPFKLGFTVIIEEGPAMTLLTYGVIFPRLFKANPRVPPLLPNLLGWMGRQNHINIVLEASDEELVRRRKSRSYRQNELREYVTMQRKWIERLDSRDTIFIDTSEEPVIGIHRKIVKVLESMIERSRREDWMFNCSGGF